MVEVCEGAPVAVSGWVLADRHDRRPCAASSLHRGTISVSNIIGGHGNTRHSVGTNGMVSTTENVYLDYGTTRLLNWGKECTRPVWYRYVLGTRCWVRYVFSSFIIFLG